jgi:hypothetical protein
VSGRGCCRRRRCRVFFIRFVFSTHTKKQRTKLLFCIINPAFVRCCETPFQLSARILLANGGSRSANCCILHALFLSLPGVCIGLRNSLHPWRNPLSLFTLSGQHKGTIFAFSSACMSVALSAEMDTLHSMLGKPLHCLNVECGATLLESRSTTQMVKRVLNNIEFHS